MWIKPAAAAVAFLACAAASAQAEPWSRHSPFLCRTVYPADQVHVWFWGGLESTLPQDVKVVCPIPDTSDRPDSQITEVRVYISRNPPSNQYAIRACRTARTGLGSTCGPPALASTQSSEIVLDPGSIWEPTDFGYLEITIGASDPHNVLEGYVLVY